MRRACMTFLLPVVAAVLVPAGARAQWKTHWTYEGPTGAEHWNQLDPDYAPCNLGKEQSPINIQKTKKAELPAPRFEPKSAPLKYLQNNGYTIRVNYHDAPGTGNFLIVGDKVEINPAGLLPHASAYYTYIGSVTAPPCTEDVTWYVLKIPVEISAEQIHAFAELYPHDVRPIQPLNGRIVKESQ